MILPTFGVTSRLVDIHFPDKNANPGRPPKGPNASYPWYWYIGPPEAPYYYQYIAPQAGTGGRGWQRTQNFPMIKILHADTQVLRPTPVLGFSSLEDAINRSGAGGPDFSWGRFNFQDPFFWKVMGVKKPEFTTIQGRPTQTVKTKAPPIAQTISRTVNQWKSFWNFGASNFNTNAAAGLPNDGHTEYPFPKTEFAVPLPTDPTIAGLAAGFDAGAFYLGPIPGGFWFLEGTVAIYKQAYSFHMGVSQLDLRHWDQSVFPPQPIDPNSTFETFDCSGYGLTTFPTAGPQIIGGG